MTDDELHEHAVKAGATVLGDPHHYIMNPDELRRFLASVRENEPPPLPY